MSKIKLPAPLRHAPRQTLERVSAVFFDIDDTFSLHGKILSESYDALWRLRKAGFRLVPVTGRPAGWCDMIARMWPIDGVVGENGAFYCSLDEKKKKLEKIYLETPKVRAANQKKLIALKKKLIKKFPGLRTPSDQPYREFDLAIDYCEDVKPWPEKRVQQCLEFCRSHGAIAKLSSIHVNTWFGRYDKLTCVRRVLKSFYGAVDAKTLAQIAYIGDSPNDEPFFEALPFTVGVANVAPFLKKMDYAPTYITEREGSFGFAELADRLIAARSKILLPKN